ncbi:hypothetical protein H0H93_003876 [Arthromyces matolae]|nr:hypothetical protein H0H93_003876 [Arthromyces matolae]
MSDANRQSFTDKASSAMKPDSEKSTFEKASDTIKGHADSLGSSMQPESQKSTSQKMGDTMSGNSNQNDESLLNKAKDAVGLGGQKK